MLLHVWPGLNFWFCLGIISSPSWVFSFLAMDFEKKATGLVSVVLILAIVLSWSASNLALTKFYFLLRRNPETDRFFRAYEGAGKTIGYSLLFFGNVGLYYFSEKSVACMLTFLSLAVYCLCALLCIQPYADFGALEFLLSASLNQALSLFGLRSSRSWLVMIACIVISGIRYCLEPVYPPEEATRDEIELESGQLPAKTHREEPPPLGARLADDNPSTSGSFLDIPFRRRFHLPLIYSPFPLKYSAMERDKVSAVAIVSEQTASALKLLLKRVQPLQTGSSLAYITGVLLLDNLGLSGLV
ncbi:hypothetical protein RHSIM_Rhsim01G0209900 [Rhododendron simsii]|uniref:Uncharacterized protein n=1 Tax=Rhododendron simsii TaxID=118357 RepID=A0A834HGR5_RHOSS|nr:hypothetical protein RHSIM_Rhsim01G0209900 [Rhododendron simsii]